MQSGKKPTPSPEQIPTPGGVTSGVGPAIQWPTGTDPLIDSGKWVAGPTAVILEQQSGWTYGVLANHVWSFAEGVNDQPDVKLGSGRPLVRRHGRRWNRNGVCAQW